MSIPEPSRRRLMLLRHAKSDWPDGVDDHDRPLLAGRGRQAGALMGTYMAKEGLVPDLALVSTARRAQETWALAGLAFVPPVARRDEPRIYEAAVGSLFEVVREADAQVRTLLLVGHNPGLHGLALTLVGAGGAEDLALLRAKYPTAGLAVIDFGVGGWDRLRPATGTLERFVTPRSIDPAR
ncbi:SixA phosphatase family protein [Castellaniella sp. S9]|uniref:SixA phosphatase family protein n=1 Tax=Castellaniella sp. S9 TaxID=2993652 RepID=UPI0022B2E5F1|nr:histidine phosphatase family protein [Castellaniella sp. S9]